MGRALRKTGGRTAVWLRLLAWAWLTALLSVAQSAQPSAQVEPATAVSARIAQILADSPATLRGIPILAAAARQAYEPRGYRPLWQGGPEARERARLLQAALDDAAAHGVDTGDLRLPAAADPADTYGAAEVDILITDAFLRYAGRIHPGVDRETRRYWAIVPDPIDPAAELATAGDPAAFASLLRALLPSAPAYDRLVDALRRYRGIAAAGGWPAVPDDGEVVLGGDDPRLATLRRRLTIEGDLAAGAADDDGDALVAAVRRFQARHGLDPDGRVGVRTLTELNVTAERRVVQILANLERWRMLPRRMPQTRVVVNVADATLEYLRDGVPSLGMRVVVGDRRHATPVLAAAITAVVLNPPWNVPRSIATREILPKLKRDPGYLARNGIVVVGREDGDPHGQRIDWLKLSADRFPFRLRQLPGPGNALGRIKFDLPNPFDVYLHDTPSKAAFKRPDRGLSHGCVRLERPEELAERLLDGAAWDADALAAAIATGETRRVALQRPVPVYLLYWTAFVDAAGLVEFRRDLYGRDRQGEVDPGRLQPIAGASPTGGCPG